MKIVGLTGGIGSGKTTVAKFFKALGIPVYIADKEAKTLMLNSKVIKRKLIQLFGDTVYKNEQLNKNLIRKAIFNDKQVLRKMNAIVHPRVARHFKRWTEKQQATFVIKEVAILFENNSYLDCDAVITVVAPKHVKIERIKARDAISETQIKAVMDNQWDDAKKVKHSDFVITNIVLEDTIKQVHSIYTNLLKNNF